VAQIYIPTPDAVQISIQYDKVYPLTYQQPATYIRFSSTVEDCVGCPYDMDEEDDLLLMSLNKTKNALTHCSEDQFEQVMNAFEQTAQIKQPYAAVDSPPVLPYEEMESGPDDDIDDRARAFAKEIYEHWKTRRLFTGNKSLLTSLKVSQYRHWPPKLTDLKTSSRLVRILTMPTLTFVFEGVRFGRYARLVVETRTAPKSSKSSAKSLKSLASC